MNLYAELEKLVFVKYAQLLQARPASGGRPVHLFNSNGVECLIDLGVHAEDKNDDDAWKEVFNVCVRVTPTRTYLEMISIPPAFQGQGIASEIVGYIANWVKFRHKAIGTDLVLYLSDLSPDYDRTKGVTTHLVNKYGLRAVDENAEY